MFEFDLLQSYGITALLPPRPQPGTAIAALAAAGVWPLACRVGGVERRRRCGAAGRGPGKPRAAVDSRFAAGDACRRGGNRRFANRLRLASGPDSPIDSEYWTWWTIGILLLMVFSLVGFLPALFLILRVKQTQLAVGLWYAYLGARCVALLLAWSFDGGTSPGLETSSWSRSWSSAAMRAASPCRLLLARRDGWRLAAAGGQTGCGCRNSATADDTAAQGQGRAGRKHAPEQHYLPPAQDLQRPAGHEESRHLVVQIVNPMLRPIATKIPATSIPAWNILHASAVGVRPSSHQLINGSIKATTGIPTSPNAKPTKRISKIRTLAAERLNFVRSSPEANANQ